jgi:hypothetical protein
LWGSVIIPNMERVRTTYAFRRERVLLIGEVEAKALAEQMKLFSELSKRAGLRPGQQPNCLDLHVSGDAMAVINAMTPDGSFPMSPNRNKANTILRFSRLVYRAGE